MADRDAWEHPLYLFARLLLGDAAAARTVVAEVLEASVKKRPPHIEHERLVMLQFRDVRRRILKNAPTAAGTLTPRGGLPDGAAQVAGGADAARLAEALRALPEPGRSAYALLLLDGLESEWIARMLGLGPAEFAETVHAARLAMHGALAPKVEAAS
jgi:DNA-directed RNA polymerase specialized sigma24 family protein